MSASETALVSVIMAVYNGEKYLAEAIQSVLEQTYANLEFIIVNDGSTDRTLEILEEYKAADSRLAVISRENRGLPTSLNEAIEVAQGDYIARMDADDVSLRNRFKKQVAFLEAHPEVGVCGTWATIFGNGQKPKLLAHPADHEELIVRLLFSTCFVHPTVMIRKKVLIDSGVRYDPNYSTAQDYELWSRLSNMTRFANLPDALLMYRCGHPSITTKNASDKAGEHYNLISKVFERELLTLGLLNSEREKWLHYTVAVNSRVARHRVCISDLDIYLTKISAMNIQVRRFDKTHLDLFLGKKFIVACYFQFKQGRFPALEMMRSRFFYSGLAFFIRSLWVSSLR